MGITFRLAVESGFLTPVNFWGVTLPNTALVGDYLLAMLASAAPGVLWSSPGWKQLDGFSTVQSTLGGVAQSAAPIPLSYALFGKFLRPDDDLSGTILPQFAVGGPPTSVSGAQPASASGTALCVAYGGVTRVEPTRSRMLSMIPPLTIAYNPTPVQTVPPFNPVVAAAVPPVFANGADWLVCPLITSGGAQTVALPSINFNLRASTVMGNNVVIALADQIVNRAGLQSGLQWGGSVLPTPLLTQAIALWPDLSNLDQEIVLYAALDRNPVHFGYEYSQEPTVICHSVGYLFKVYAGPREARTALFNASVLSTANLLLTRPDGSTATLALNPSPDGYYAYAVSRNDTFPYTGVYYLQLQLQWANGSVQYSSQSYLTVRPQGGQ